MSALILPVRSPLKPDRAWDVPRPAGSRHRSPWWRKLLGGRDGLTRLQPGSCCGCTAPGPCAGCANANSTLHVSFANRLDCNQTGRYSGSFTITYDPANQRWIGDVPASNGGSCTAGCPNCFNGCFKLIIPCSDFPDLAFLFCDLSPTGGSAIPPDTYTCSPFNATYTDGTGATWTVTN